MGENAEYNGEEVKIGTCENMYYLRWDQRHLVKPLRGNVDPADPAVLDVIRFRFPWPDEDGTEPGQFRDHDRALALYGVTLPDGVKHEMVQFCSRSGFRFSIQCPQDPAAAKPPGTVYKNGWRGDVLLCQQAWRGGRLVPIAKCGGCDCLFRLEDPDSLRPALDALRRVKREFPSAIADRIEATYAVTAI